MIKSGRKKSTGMKVMGYTSDIFISSPYIYGLKKIANAQEVGLFNFDTRYTYSMLQTQFLARKKNATNTINLIIFFTNI